MKTKLLSIFLLFHLFLSAQNPGDLDATLNPLPGPNGTVQAIIEQADTKIVIAGGFTAYNNLSRGRIVRINSDGSLDSAFNFGVGADNVINCMVMQNDGKIVIAGGFTTYNGVPRNRIARLNADGSLDTSFNPGTGANNAIQAIALLHDGKIIIGGLFTTFNGIIKNRIARLTTDGSPDNSFSTGTGADLGIHSIAVRPDGKILIGGLFTMYNGAETGFLAQLQPNGVLDTTFQAGTNIDSGILSVILQEDEKILIGGFFDTYNGINRMRIARLESNGTLDTSFNPGTGANQLVWSLALTNDNTVLVGGHMTNFNGTAQRGIVSLNTNGSINTEYNFGTGFDGIVRKIVPVADGKILVGGTFNMYNNVSRGKIARLNGTSLGIATTSKIHYSYFPNPLKETLHIKAAFAIDFVEVYTMLGQQVARFPVNAPTGEIDLSKLAAANYVIRVNSGSDNSSFVIIKE